MDTPLPEDEDDAIFSLDPLEIVERVLTAENLVFDRTEEGEVAVTLAGDWRDYELWFAWRPEADCLQLCLSMDLHVKPEQKAAAYELISIINQRVWLGHYEVWEDGEIIFRHAMAIENPAATTRVVARRVPVTKATRFRWRALAAR